MMTAEKKYEHNCILENLRGKKDWSWLENIYAADFRPERFFRRQTSAGILDEAASPLNLGIYYSYPDLSRKSNAANRLSGSLNDAPGNITHDERPEKTTDTGDSGTMGNREQPVWGLYSSQYVGILPLVDRTTGKLVYIPDGTQQGKPCLIEIQSRFAVSPLMMLNEVLKGDDYYENPGMLTYHEFTVDELLQKDRQGQSGTPKSEKLLFGVLKGAGKVPLPMAGEGAAGNNPLAVLGNEESVFEMLRFVSLAKELCRRTLKKQSSPVEENLTGKIKGRILLNKQIKYNLVRGQFQKTYCSYNRLQNNTTENRIIKYTLYLCSRSPLAETLSDDLTFCQRALADVPLQKCSLSDFTGLKSNGAFRQYRETLALARRILGKFYLDYEAATDGSNQTEKGSAKFCSRLSAETDPYFINMDLLFEYYCRAIFRKAVNQFNEAKRKENSGEQAAQKASEASGGKKGKTKGAAKILRLRLEPSIAYGKGIHLFQQKYDGSDSRRLKMFYMPTYIPDILITSENEKGNVAPFLVADAKYSFVDKSQSDVKRARTHQILFYMNVLNCNYGGLVGFDDTVQDQSSDATRTEGKAEDRIKIIAAPYLFYGKEQTNEPRKKLFFLPVMDSATQGSADAYATAVKDWITKLLTPEDSDKQQTAGS